MATGTIGPAEAISSHGTALANAVGIPTDTAGVDWSELLMQVLCQRWVSRSLRLR